LRWWAGRRREVGLRQAAVEGRRDGGRRRQQGAVGAADVALPHQSQVVVGVLLDGAQDRPGVQGPGDGGEVGATSRVARRGHQAPPVPGVSVGAGAEGGVQALRAEAGGEGHPRGDAVLPARFQAVGGGAGRCGGGGAGGGGWSQAQEVGEHQVFFAQESALVVDPGALRPAQQLKEFCDGKKTRSHEFPHFSRVEGSRSAASHLTEKTTLQSRCRFVPRAKQSKAEKSTKKSKRERERRTRGIYLQLHLY